METVISFTATEALNAIIWVCGAITAIAAAAAVIAKVIHGAKAPDRKQNDRITQLEEASEKHTKCLLDDRKRLDGMDIERKVIMKSLLALLAHGIDGNDIKAMQDAKGELTTLLINK